MPGVTDWQQSEVTWEQGPIRALVGIDYTTEKPDLHHLAGHQFGSISGLLVNTG